MSIEVIFSTSYDDKYSPHNILNSSNSMFWTSTGLYPQEIVLSLSSGKIISELAIQGVNIKKLSIETCENDSAVKFITQFEIDNISKKTGLQDIQCKFINKVANKLIKIIIHEGHGFFCCINSINIK
jgi:heat shock protein beta-11